VRVDILVRRGAGSWRSRGTARRAGRVADACAQERLPTPFGLVRFGVAPDHPDTKAVTHKFERVAADPRVGLLCAVELGQHVPLAALRQRYHAVVLAVGAPADRALRVPGEALAGSFSARQFVEWYNAHPEAAQPRGLDLRAGDTAVVFGLGNVALDCARILLRSPDELARTDIAAHALAALRGSAIRRVVLVGRRGPAQTACTPKELRELLSLPGVRVSAPPEQLALQPEDAQELSSSRVRRRAVEELLKATSRPHGAFDRELEFRFLRSPAALLPSSDGARVGAVRLEVNALQGAAGARVARGTGVLEELPAALVLSSIGYRSVPTPGAPFDAASGTVPHERGAVRSAGPGLYVAGWVKRGPSGIIGTNLVCAEETVATLAEDAAAGRLLAPDAPCGVDVLARMAEAAGGRPVTLGGWLRIDAAERAAGAAAGKPREKEADLDKLHALAHG
jgi:adrenodoxin-NADP+ reductase